MELHELHFRQNIGAPFRKLFAFYCLIAPGHWFTLQYGLSLRFVFNAVPLYNVMCCIVVSRWKLWPINQKQMEWQKTSLTWRYICATWLAPATPGNPSFNLRIHWLRGCSKLKSNPMSALPALSLVWCQLDCQCICFTGTMFTRVFLISFFVRWYTIL